MNILAARVAVRNRSLLVTPLLLLTLGASVRADPLLLAPFLSFDTGSSPYSVATDDLNGDGKPDLVTANYYGYSVSVLLGNGDGTFGAKTDFGTGYDPISLAIGDFNGDGKPDLVTSDDNVNTISVLLGNGDGTFGARTDFGTGYKPHSVAISDFNGDGNRDVVTANYGSTGAGTVSVLLGNGDGTFGAKADFGVGANPLSVATGDLNADGKPDLVTSNYPGTGIGTVSVLLGNGDGTLGAKTDFGTGASPRSVAIGDFNGDGKPDLVTANNDYVGTVSVLLGRGDGTFGAETNFGTGYAPSSVAIVDLNGDGNPDLVVANYATTTVSALLGDGNGSFGAKTDFDTGYRPSSAAIGDFNCDGKFDVVTANDYSSTVSVLLGNGNGTFGADTDLGTGSAPRSVAIADVNGDGKPDLVTANDYSSTVSVLLGSGNGAFGARTDFGVGATPSSVAIGDLNGDGKPDLVTANSGDNSVSVLRGNGDGNFGARTDFGTGAIPRSVVIEDMNGDGEPDLATANSGDNSVSVLRGNGDGNFGARADFGTGYRPVAVASKDLNGDGKPDLVTANDDDREEAVFTISVLLGQGDGTFGAQTDILTGSHPYSVAVGDLNADGKPDLVTAIYNARAVGVLLGHGDGTFDQSSFRTGLGPVSAAIGDMNGDGKPDLVTANSYANTASVLLGNGDGTFTAKTDLGTVGIPSSVAIGDLNTDGRPDVAVAGGPNTVTVLLNIGPATCPAAPLSFDLTPNVLNLHAMGRWVTATLEPEPPATPADIDISSIRLNHSVQVDPLAPTSIGDLDGDGRPDLTVKFSRMAVELTVPEGEVVPVTVSGTIASGCFEVTEVIRVIRAHVAAPSAGSVLQSGSAAEVRWDTPAGIQIQSVAVLFSSDDGSTWNLVDQELPNTGRYLWTVPGAATDQARIAVVLVESADSGGNDVVGVLGVSGRFAIASPLAVGGTSIGLSLHGSVPNPSRSPSVSFTLPDVTPARLVAYDISGREVSRREVGHLGIGHHVVNLSPRKELAPGVYLVHLIQGNRRLVARAVVIR